MLISIYVYLSFYLRLLKNIHTFFFSSAARSCEISGFYVVHVYFNPFIFVHRNPRIVTSNFRNLFPFQTFHFANSYIVSLFIPSLSSFSYLSSIYPHRLRVTARSLNNSPTKHDFLRFSLYYVPRRWRSSSSDSQHRLSTSEFFHSRIYPIIRSILLQHRRGAHQAGVHPNTFFFPPCCPKSSRITQIQECRSQKAGTNGADAERGIAPLKTEPVSFVHRVSLFLVSLFLLPFPLFGHVSLCPNKIG